VALAGFTVVEWQASGQSAPSLALRPGGGFAQLSVRADVGSPCTIQYTTALASNSLWLPLTNVTFFSNSFQLMDPGSSNDSVRFYRALIAVPTNMLWVPAGSYVMGSPTNETQRSSNETQHNVTLTKGFFMSKYLVTQSSFLSLMNTNPSYFTPARGFTLDLTRPVEQVTWFDATNYCSQLTQLDRAAGRIFTNWSYRLPTESEWEYACRAGTVTPVYYGSNLLSGMANFDGEFEYWAGIGTSNNPTGILLNRTSSVGSYQPNPWGLLDMAGNLWEWCQDWFGNYPTGPVTDPPGPATGLARVFRGGAFNAPGRYCRSAYRDSYLPSSGFNTVGFRVVLAYGP
jgi:formylglycine-generating enzyme required for sulfatase activity